MSEIDVSKGTYCGMFNSLKKLIWVTGLVLGFMHNFKAFLSCCEVMKGIVC